MTNHLIERHWSFDQEEQMTTGIIIRIFLHDYNLGSIQDLCRFFAPLLISTILVWYVGLCEVFS